MAIEIVVTTDRFHNDPASRDFINYIRANQIKLGLSEAVLYYDFPAYVDYETETTRPDILLFSPQHGFVAIRFLVDTLFVRSSEPASVLDAGLNDFASNLYSRLLRSRELRANRTQAVVDVYPVIFDVSTNGALANAGDLESESLSSFEQFASFLSAHQKEPLNHLLVSEVRSVVEGAKALSRPQRRTIALASGQYRGGFTRAAYGGAEVDQGLLYGFG